MLCVLPSCCQLCVNTWRRLSHLLQKKQYQCPYLGWCHKWLHSILPKRQSAGVANSSFTPDDTILALAAEILCPPITSEIWNWTHECNMQDIHFESLEWSFSKGFARIRSPMLCVLSSCCQLCVNTWRRLVQNVRGPIFHFEFNTVVISFNFLLSVWAFGQFVLRWQRKISSSSVGEPACAFILDLGSLDTNTLRNSQDNNLVGLGVPVTALPGVYAGSWGSLIPCSLPAAVILCPPTTSK